jgi:malonyl-CoA/methylmalonyl-CoA synthetase
MVGSDAMNPIDAWRRHLGQEVDPEALIAELSAGTLAEAFAATAAARADHPALTIDGVARTHGELDDAAARFAAALRQRGVAPGDAILLATPSSMAMVEAYLGALRAGAVVVLANPSYTASELNHLANDSGAVAAVAAGPARGLVAGMVEAVLHPEDAAGVEPLPLDPDAATQAGLLAYTSGTTGKPKAVPLTHANVLASVRAVMRAWRWSADDVLVHALPLFHQHGLSGVNVTLLSGARGVLHSKFDPATVCATIADERATVVLGVPAMYERLAGWEGFAAADLGSLRLVVSGSAPLSRALAERVAAVVGQVPLERYGTTESGLNVSNLYEGPRRPGTVGIPLPGIEMKVVDEAGETLDDGTDGEIVVRGPHVFAGYRGDPEATADSFFAGGWFRTGDLGRVEPEDGFLSITGRKKELIISGGMNVYPREVELALEEAESVAQAAVVGLPSERWGEAVVAAVVPVAETVDEEQLLTFVAERLAPYKRPKRVVAIEALPVNHMGKVVRAEVGALLAHRRLLERAARTVAEVDGGEPVVDPPPCP